MKSFDLSVLDLAPVKQGRSIQDSFQESLELARHTEKLGYVRYWFAEHHNMASIASSATSVLIGFVAGGTSSIRVGSGGIMLPNHSSLVIAEQFGTLESLYPGRIDLGIGRAPGTDALTAKALGRNPAIINEQFPRQILELQMFFSKENENGLVRAIPGEGCHIPLYILGSSTDSAWLASQLGLPYVFAAHFAPEQMETAFEIYRQNYQPSEKHPKPWVMACVNGMAADTTAEAQKIANTLYSAFLNIIRNDRKPYGPPPETMDGLWSPVEEMGVKQKLRYSLIGDRDGVSKQLTAFQKKYQLDEIMISSMIYDQQARLRSYEILMEVGKEIGKG